MSDDNLVPASEPDEIMEATDLGPRHLTLPPNITAEETCQLLENLTAFQESAPFWIGDALNQAEQRFGEDVWQFASEELGKKSQTITNWKSVMSRVPPSVRKVELGFTKHSIVAMLPVERQRYWLKRCIDEDLTATQLSALTSSEKEPIRLKRYGSVLSENTKVDSQAQTDHKKTPEPKIEQNADNKHIENPLDGFAIGVYIGSAVPRLLDENMISKDEPLTSAALALGLDPDFVIDRVRRAVFDLQILIDKEGDHSNDLRGSNQS